MGSMYLGQGSRILFVGSWISLLDSLVFRGLYFWWMEIINDAGVFQEEGGADSRTRSRSQV